MARLTGYLLLFGLIVAVVRITLLLGLLLAFVIGLFTRPIETISVVAFLIILSLIGKFPVPSLAIIAVVGLVTIFVKAGKSAPPPPDP